MRKLVEKLVHEKHDMWPALTNRLSIVGRDLRYMLEDATGKGSARRVLHVGIHRNGNVGDTLLFACVRHLLDQSIGPVDWRLRSVWSRFAEADARAANETVRAVVVGGGGLFLRDSVPNENSGWQWNSTLSAVRSLKKPLILFAVGYNRFPGQPEFAPIFREHLNEVAQRCAFFGIRNSGSIRALRGYLDVAHHRRLMLQPCPTTMLRRYYPGIGTRTTRTRRVLVLNIAFDRRELRFGGNEIEVRDQVVAVMRRLVDSGWHLALAIHTLSDEGVVDWFAGSGVAHRIVRLTRASADDAVGFYATADLVVGMRGHSLMIPFGLGVPIIALGGHDKLDFFLEDVGHPEWSTPLLGPRLSDRLWRAVERVDDERNEIEGAIQEAQDRFWNTTRDNLDDIRRIIGN